MALGSLNHALRRTLFRLHHAGADGELLERFAASEDQAAFAELVRRHGPMVLQVCRRVLGHHQDAEDAFQATFVVLARRAGAVAGMESLGGWLHGVACRTAMNARKLRGRRQVITGSRADGAGVTGPAEAPGAELMRADLNALLDEELARLPDKYRTPIVLCHLEGKSTEEAAQQLGWPSGTVKTQLSRGRDLLRERLTRRGMTLGAAGLAAVFSEQMLPAAVPANLLNATAQGAAVLAGNGGASGLITAAAAELAATLQQDLARRKLRWAVALLLVLGGAGITLALALPRGRLEGTRPVAAAGSQIIDMPRAIAPFRRALLSRDDRYLALGDSDGRVTIFQMEWGIGQLRLNKLPLRLDGPHSSMAFSPDGKKLAVGCTDGTVQVWDPATGSKLTTLRTAHPGMAIELAYSPDGQALAAMVAKGGLTTWDLRKPGVQSKADLPEQTGGVQMVFTLQGELFVVHDRNGAYRVRCWDAATGQEKKIDFPPLPRVVQPGKKPATTGWAVALTADGSMVVACNDGTVHLWQRATNSMKYLFTLPEDSEGLNFMVGPRGDTVTCVFTKTNRVMIWDVATNQKLHQFERPFEGGIICRAYSADGKKFFWTGYAHAAKPGADSVPTAGGIIDLEVRRREIASVKEK